MTPRVCARPGCDNEVVGRSHKKYCSQPCQTVASSRRRLGRQADGSMPTRTCPNCKAKFMARSARSTYCSRRCIAKASYLKGRKTAPKAKIKKRRCAECRVLYAPSSVKSARQQYCSTPCRQAVHNRAEAAKRAGDDEYRVDRSDQSILINIKSRMRECGSTAAFDRTVRLNALIERDGGICWLCSKPCAERDKVPAIRPDYPTIDHLVPISKGGAHTWENVRLAHKGCNSEKHDDVCGSCGGPISEMGEPLCAKCADKGRSVRVKYGVCAHCGYVEMPGGYCSRCKAKGAGLWVRDDLTLKAAQELSRSMGFEPKGLSLRRTTEWVMWAA